MQRANRAAIRCRAPRLQGSSPVDPLGINTGGEMHGESGAARWHGGGWRDAGAAV
jgi:hypothetical protein